MKTLTIAYACLPDQGSEPGAGWQSVQAALSVGSVLLITNSELTDVRLPGLQVLTVHTWLERFAPVAPSSMWHRLNSQLWQFSLSFKLRQICRNSSIDVVHHATYASDWAYSALLLAPSEVGVVWGPVGGASLNPWIFRRWLPSKFLLAELFAYAGTSLARTLVGRLMAKRASVIVAQNSFVASKLMEETKTVVFSNQVVLLPDRNLRGARREKTLGASGRLLPHKGLYLLLETLTQHSMSDWRLEICGDGGIKSDLQAKAIELGVSDRITWLGRLSHEEHLNWLQTVSAYAFLSFREGAPWTLAELHTLQIPTISLAAPYSLDSSSKSSIVSVPIQPTTSLAVRLGNKISAGIDADLPPADPSQFSSENFAKKLGSALLAAYASVSRD